MINTASSPETMIRRLKNTLNTLFTLFQSQTKSYSRLQLTIELVKMKKAKYYSENDPGKHAILPRKNAKVFKSRAKPSLRLKPPCSD